MTDYGLVRPCPKCPFRTDVPPYLRPDRVAEIARDVQGGSEFYCHQTTVAADDEVNMTTGPKTQVCAGSLILMEKMGTPNQMMRIAERIGLYDPRYLDMDAPVHASWMDMQQHFSEEDVEPCGVVGPYCEAPAGYAIGGSVVLGTVAADFVCSLCGTPVCGECSEGTKDGCVCLSCNEEEEEE